MHTLNYLPLESLKARYTELLSAPGGWFDTEMSKHFRLNRIDIDATASATIINNGAVLDSVNRPLHAMKQVITLLERVGQGKVYLDDFFHPGIESLPYSGRDYELFAFCWAQSFDKYDFTRPMIEWMRPYEAMMFAITSKVFVASPLLQDIICSSLNVPEERVPVVGLPFNSANVRSIYDPAYQPGVLDVVYSSRFDCEKRPGFFLDLVEMMPEVRFAICTGHDQLKGNDFAAVNRAYALASKYPDRLSIHAGLSKPEYYSVLKHASVQVNTGMQDWVSFTLLEALSHGCLPVYPCHRDFPVVFAQNPGHMYSPDSREDAAALITSFVTMEQQERVRRLNALEHILTYHDSTLERISAHILST